MTRLSDSYRMKITPLAPIHVGSGESMCPGEYFVLDDMICAVNLGNIPSEEMGDLTGKLLGWIDENPVTWVSNVNQSDALKALIRKHTLFRCKSTKSVLDGINARWGLGVSGLEIALLNRTLASAIIPGSSIKGAVRTALLWQAVDGQMHPVPAASDASTWERRTMPNRREGPFGGIADDPLRNLKISDAVTGSIGTWVLQPSHVGMSDEAKAQELQDYRECFPAGNRENPYAIRGTLAIETGMLKRRGMEGLISRDAILDACADFYGEVLEQEILFWQKNTDTRSQECAKWYEAAREYAEKHDEGALIRLGWGCGMNTVGLNLAKPYGKHPPKGKNPNFYYDAKTRVLIGRRPPGWALFTLEPD